MTTDDKKIDNLATTDKPEENTLKQLFADTKAIMMALSAEERKKLWDAYRKSSSYVDMSDLHEYFHPKITKPESKE